MKNVVMTYIVGGYDWLKDPVVVSEGWDYLCFSDRELDSDIWQPRPLPELPVGPDDPKRYTSLLKILHHRFLAPDYGVCVTVDGSMTINTCMHRLLEEFWDADADLALARHPERNCAYEEAETVIKLHLDSPTLVRGQMRRYATEGMPAAAGLYGARILIKNHHSPRLRGVCEAWASELLCGSRRDQLSLPYVLWRATQDGKDPLRIRAFDFDEVYQHRRLFTISPHLRSATHWPSLADAGTDAPAEAPKLRQPPVWISKPLLAAANRRLCRRFEPYLAARFRPIVGYQPNLAVPRRYHEKVMWRKIFDHNPLFVAFCDKLATKSYVAARTPDVPTPETLWVGTDVREIPSSVLREPVVIKAAHGCGFNHFWNPGSSNLRIVETLARGWLDSTHGQGDYEWGYSGVTRRIFVERFVGPAGATRPVDISIRCADGQPILASIITENKTPRKAIGYFSITGQRMLMSHNTNSDSSWPELPAGHDLPPSFARAMAAAAKLSQGIDYARFDFMTDGPNLYAGEITVYPASGISPAAAERDADNDLLLASGWDLRKSWFLRVPQPGRLGLYAQLLRSVLDDEAGHPRGGGRISP